MQRKEATANVDNFVHSQFGYVQH